MRNLTLGTTAACLLGLSSFAGLVVAEDSGPIDAIETTGSAFTRGDANEDGRVDYADVVVLLDHLFGSSAELPCAKAADINDDGHLDLGDVVGLARFLMGQGTDPAEPFPQPGGDTTPDSLQCHAEEKAPITPREDAYHVFHNGVSCITEPCPDLTARGSDGDVTITELDISGLNMDAEHEARLVKELYAGMWIVKGIAKLGGFGPAGIGNTLIILDLVAPSGQTQSSIE